MELTIEQKQAVLEEKIHRLLIQAYDYELTIKTVAAQKDVPDIIERELTTLIAKRNNTQAAITVLEKELKDVCSPPVQQSENCPQA